MVAQYARTMPQKSGLTVAVTGISGYLGSRLLEELESDDRVARVVGFDRRPPRVSSSKLVFDEVDIRNAGLEARLAGVDVLVHLAFIMDPIKDEASMRDVNVNGSQNVFTCACNAGVPKIVYTSTATVYGAHPNNDFPLTEESPLRANFDFSYAAHKLEVEFVIKELRKEHPGTSFTVFRPAIVFGPNVDNAWSHLLQFPLVAPLVRGHAPPLQFVHEDDVVRALVWSLDKDLDGAFNLAAPDWLEMDDITEVTGKRRVEVDEDTAYRLFERLWALGMSEAPAGMLHYVMHPWVVSVEKLAEAGFTTKRSAREAFLEAHDRSKHLVRLGRKSFRKETLARGAAAGAGLAGAAALVRGVRRARGAPTG
jgi:UDP-glucose 4-epimerase